MGRDQYHDLWLDLYREERAKMLQNFPTEYYAKFVKGEPTWWDSFYAALFTGFWFGTFVRGRSGGRKLPYLQEAALVWAILQSAKKLDEWAATSYTFTHKSTNTQIWIANGRGFVTIGKAGDAEVAFRVRSQRHIMAAYKRWKRARDAASALSKLDEIHVLTAKLERP